MRERGGEVREEKGAEGRRKEEDLRYEGERGEKGGVKMKERGSEMREG